MTRSESGIDIHHRNPMSACEECGTTFRPGNSLGRYCSSACRQRAWRRSRPGYQSAATKRYLEADPARQERRREYMKEYVTRPEVIARRNERNRAKYAQDPTTFIERANARHERRARLLQAVKTTCGCIDCGTRDGLLAFDHRPGTVKWFNVAAGVHRTLPILIAEIEKCDVRCPRCHALRHERVKREQRRAA